jgi:ribosomal protein S20
MKHIYSKKQLDEAETRKFLRQIISAVDHLHKAGIIHRWAIRAQTTFLQCNSPHGSLL